MSNVLAHVFVSAKADGADPTQVQPSNWNAGHSFSGGSNGNLIVRDTSDATYGAAWASTLTYLSSVLTQTRSAIAATPTDGFVLANATAATGGATVQMSPRVKWSGTAWNSVGAASETDFFTAEVLPATAAGATTATWRLGSSIAGAAVGNFLTYSSGGVLATPTAFAGPGTVASAGDVRLQNSTSIQFSDSGAAARVLIGTGGTNTNEAILGNATYATRSRSVMATPTVLANGDWWVESNTGAVTGASGALFGRLNGASVMLSPAIRSTGRLAAQTAAQTLASYTAQAADGTYAVSANINVTTATAHNFTVTVTYTDETNTSRTLTLGFTQLSGATLLTAITNITGAGPYESPVYHIRVKASTAITIATTGTFTTVTYNGEGAIRQLN